MIIEQGPLWLVVDDDGSGAEDPLAGLPDDYRAQIELAYGRYCSCIEMHKSLHRCRGADLDYFSLDEGKSLGAFPEGPVRREYGRKLKANPSYRRLIGKEQSAASREFDKESSRFRERLMYYVDRYMRGDIKLDQLRRQTVEQFTTMYKRAWELGKAASGILRQKRPRPASREEESWFRSAVREELKYWNAFLDELGKSTDFSKRSFTIRERVSMYADTVGFMFNSARMSGLPDNVLLHWFPKEKKGMCKGCEYIVKHSPFPRDVMPTTPKAGDTPCLMHCKHRVIARYVSPSEVDARRRILPSKQQMLRALGRIMGPKLRKYRRQKNKDYNPWIGAVSWGDLR